jgi:hypothetical protein
LCFTIGKAHSPNAGWGLDSNMLSSCTLNNVQCVCGDCLRRFIPGGHKRPTPTQPHHRESMVDQHPPEHTMMHDGPSVCVCVCARVCVFGQETLFIVFISRVKSSWLAMY